MSLKEDTLRSIRFGERIAEDELNDLERYFVATDQWSRVYSGEVDVVYGSKGAGKSAIYALIEKRQNDLFDRHILIRSAENVRGNTAFSGIIADPPPTERDFIELWKLYFLILTVSTLREYNLARGNASGLVNVLEQAGLLPQQASLSQLFEKARAFIWERLFPNKESVEWSFNLDSATGIPTVARKTTFSNAPHDTPKSQLPLDDFLSIADLALQSNGYSLWVLFDRLDVAFNDTPDLERNALRALFRMYNDFKGFDNIRLKIFVRDDIWDRITAGGFAEASHITKTTTIEWSYESLVNLFVRRLLNNASVIKMLNVERDKVIDDFPAQLEILKQIFPDKVETGNNPETFRWMTTRIQDGLGKPAPRELIHLSEMIRQRQVGQIERGEPEPADQQLFDRAVFKPALSEVSKVRYGQTFKAENPSLIEYTDKLKGQKTEQTVQTLASLWGVQEAACEGIVDRLVKAGLFEKRIQKVK